MPKDGEQQRQRRRELLDTAAEVFAAQGYSATTVRTIADAAGMLAGSLYYHFDSKESMLDEILSAFLTELWERYDAVLSAGLGPRETLEELVTESFRQIDRHRPAVAIYQKESRHLAGHPRFGYLADSQQKFEKAWQGTLERGVAAQVFRSDLDVRLAYRFLRDTVWVAASWYRPGGALSPEEIAGQYLSMVLDGIAVGDARGAPGDDPQATRRSSSMGEAYIVEAVRTPVGRRRGGLAAVHPADLGAHVLTALVERSGVDPAAVEDVVFGCLDTVGPQAGDIARTCWLAAGLPEEVPGTTVDRQCGSSQQAVHFAAQGVMSGTQDLVVAGGVQNMSQVPIAYASRQATEPLGLTEGPFAGSAGWRARYGGQPVNQFHGAELIARKWGISRREMEEFALRSHRRAVRAQDEGRFDRELAPYGDVAADEGPRRDTTPERMAALEPVAPGGTITAACSSQVSDGAAALLVASERAVREHGLTPRARIRHLSARGEDPIRMLTAPIPATAYALKKSGMALADMDLVEINEAFAPVVLAWLRETGADEEKVNVNGGAIALGHPLGATGARLMTTLLHELERTGGRFGLQTMCEGGGQANVTIVERT